jgi:CBS-domain-containing membrane protein
MRRFIAIYLTRHEPVVDNVSNLKAGLAAMLGMVLVGQLSVMTGLPLLLAPLGATAVLLFAQPSSPLSQPVNVMLGYLVGTIICESAFVIFPGWWMAAAISVGLIVIVMRAFRVTHPPAGAMPILAFGESVHGVDLFLVIFVGCVTLIALALIVHRIPPRRQYPLRSGE